MDLIQQSWQRLFSTEIPYSTQMEYNRRLGDFNANISLRRNKVQVNLNLQWKDIDEEIKIGLIQHLILKVVKKKKNTQNITLYNNFIKNVHIMAPKTEPPTILRQSYDRLNIQFFSQNLERPNLQWGQASFRKLAHYNFHNDTVTVSGLFKDARQEVLDYIVYHELLHKYHKFQQKNGRSSYHSAAFRQDEKKFPNWQGIERELQTISANGKKAVKTPKKRFFDFLKLKL